MTGSASSPATSWLRDQSLRDSSRWLGASNRMGSPSASSPRSRSVPVCGYSLLGRGARRSDTLRTPSRLPPPSTTAVIEIYPTADEVPVNLLKLYVRFSGPMSEGWAFGGSVHVRHAKRSGEPPRTSSPRAEPELWDRERTRLTMPLDPGRIKRGLVPNEEAGTRWSRARRS